jgi:hypothetical protein
VTSEVIEGFNRDTVWLATGVLGAVVVAALLLALQEHPTKVNPTEEAIPAGNDLSLYANEVTVGSVVAKGSNGKMASREGNGVDHAFNKTSPQDHPAWPMKPTATAPTPFFAFTPEVGPDGAAGIPECGTSALRQDSAHSIGPEARNTRNRSSVASKSIDVKKRLIELWHQSLAKIGKSRKWIAFSNLESGAGRKAADTSATNH